MKLPVVALMSLVVLLLAGCVSLFDKLPHKKWGFIDKTGRMVIAAQFDDVSRDQFGGCTLTHKVFRNFSAGLCAVRLGDKWGFIDKAGHLRVSAMYDNAGTFSEGLACVRRGTKYGYIDTSGAEVVPLRFDFPAQAASASNANPDWDFTQSLMNQFEFSEGLAVASKRDKFGYIDKKGSFVIQPIFVHAAPFVEGVASVQLLEGSQRPPGNAFIDKSGTITATVAKHCIDYSDKAFVATNGKYGAERRLFYLDAEGKQLFASEFEDARIFSEGLAAVAPRFDALNHGRAYGYIGKDGAMIIEPQFEVSGNNLAGNFRNGRAVVSRTTTDGFGNSHNAHGVIDKAGNWIVPPQFDHISAYCDGLARAFVENRCVYLDMSGKIAVRTNTVWGNSFSEGLAAVMEP